MPRRRRPPRAGAVAELPPLRIAAQIATLQALYYAVALVFMLFTALVSGSAFGLDLVLGWRHVRGDTTNGWLVSFVWLLDGGLCMPIAMVVLIARSKLVPDFALTIYLIHLILTTLYSRSLPAHAMWWATMLASAALSVALGMWGCRYRELQPVFFGGTRVLGGGGSVSGSGSGAASGAAEEGAPLVGDEEMGFAHGMGRGRRADGAGEYEMAKLEPAT